MPDSASQFFERNKAWLAPGDHVYNTDLGEHEPAFQQWVQQNKIPFDVSSPISDYDMRGFWLALQSGDPKARSAVNPNDNRMHFPDYWKTPYHETFSAESQWADPGKAPQWNEKDQLVIPDGTVVHDERAAAVSKMVQQHQANMSTIKSLRAPMNINPVNPQGNDLRPSKGAQVGGIGVGRIDQLKPTPGLY